MSLQRQPLHLHEMFGRPSHPGMDEIFEILQAHKIKRDSVGRSGTEFTVYNMPARDAKSFVTALQGSNRFRKGKVTVSVKI